MTKSWIKYLCVFILSAAAATYFRLYPLWGHIWSPTHEQATMAVVLNLKQTFLNKIHEQYPQMPLDQADRLASEKLNSTLRNDNAHVRQSIERLNQTLTKNSKSKEPIYLLEADPFYFYNLTENLLMHGNIADKIHGNKYFNPLMGAPFGYWQPLSVHPYIGFLLYKIIHGVDPSISLMSAVAFTPLVLSVLALAAFLWCGSLLGLRPGALLVGSFYFVLAPIFLKRSSLGWYDTDPYHLIFPFIFLGTFFKSLDAQETLARYLTPFILSILLILYSLIWQGWIFLFFMLFMCAGTIAAFAFFIRKDTALTKTYAYLSILFLILIATIGALIYGFENFLSFFSEGSAELTKFTVKGMNLWPNLFIEVGELKKSSFSEIIANTGGIIFIFGSILGLIYGLQNSIKHWRERSALKIVLISIFLLVTIVLTLKAERFAIFTLVPLTLFFSLGVDALLSFLGKRKNSLLATIGIITLLIAMCWINANRSIRTVLTPIYNSVWNEAMLAIKEQTPSDSIINTWWPPGHFIKGVAKRRVPFDGASLSEGAVGYWMANILLSTDENQARGLLRMLNLSGNRAVEYLTDHGLKTSLAVSLLKLIAAQSLPQAHAALKPFLVEEKYIRELLLLTHAGTPHSYLLIYNEMVDENVGLVFVGRRNLQKVELVNSDPTARATIPSPNSKEFIEFLWELSGGPAKFSPPLSLVAQSPDTLNFNEGLNIRKDMGLAIINSAQYGQGVPAGMVYLKDGRLITQEFPNAGLNYYIVLYQQNGQTMCRLMDKVLAESMIIRMFFFDGADLKNFKLLKSSSDLTGRTQIKTFEALWN